MGKKSVTAYKTHGLRSNEMSVFIARDTNLPSLLGAPLLTEVTNYEESDDERIPIPAETRRLRCRIETNPALYRGNGFPLEA